MTGFGLFMLLGMAAFLIYDAYVWHKTGFPPGISDELKATMKKEEAEFNNNKVL